MAKSSPANAQPVTAQAGRPQARLQLTGPPRLIVGARDVRLERKVSGLLAYVALEGEAPRGALAALLWPDLAEKDARNNLRQLLFKLKKAADAEVVGGGEVLHLAGAVEVDARATANQVGVLLDGWEFADCPRFDEWLQAARERLAGAQRKRLAEQASALESAGRYDDALVLAEQLLHSDPLGEDAHRRLIRLHYLRGDRAAAIAAFERCAEALRNGLGLQPAAETRELVAAIGSERPAVQRPLRPAVPVTVLRPPHMIGRDRELAALRDAWEDSRAFLVLGEPGLGKSRLLAEFAATTRLAVSAAARPGDRAIPYASLARLLRKLIETQPQLTAAATPDLARLMPEIDTAGTVPAEASRLALEAAIDGLLAQAQAAGLHGLVLDDLHFADAASIEMLQALAAAEAPGLRWGFAQRPAEGDASAAELQDALTEAHRLDAIPLAPLTEAEMIELIDSLGVPQLTGAQLGAWLTRHTGGNPLFALETLKNALASGQPLTAGHLPAPVSVGALIDRRLKQLSPAALALARVAALAGVDFSAPLAEHVLRTPALALADAWSELEAAQVLRGEAFAHDLIFEATRRSVPQAIARHTSRSIAEFLEGRSCEPARLAEHWLAADETVRAVPHLHEAAKRAEAAARFGEARELIERAIAAASAAGLRRETLQMQNLLLDLMRERASGEDKLRLIRQMYENAESADDRLRICFTESFVHGEMGHIGKGIEVVQRTLADADLLDAATPLRVVELRYGLSSSFLAYGRTQEALDQLQVCEPAMREHPDLQFRGWFRSDYARALFQTGQLGPAEEQIEIALQIARQVGRKRMVSGVLQVAANIAQAAGRIQLTADRLQEARLLVADSPDSSFAWFLTSILGSAMTHLGRYRDAIALIESALARKDSVSPAWAFSACVHDALIWAELGQLQRLRRSIEAAQALPLDAEYHRGRLVFALRRLQIAWLHDEPTAEWLDATEVEVERVNETPYRWMLALMRMVIAPQAGQLAQARAVVAAATETGHMGHALLAHLAAAHVSRLGDDRRGVVAATSAALKLMHRHTLPGLYRGAQWWLAFEAARDIDAALARQALQEGVDWVNTVARYHVPEPFQDSFLQRNRFNRALLQTALKSVG